MNHILLWDYPIRVHVQRKYGIYDTISHGVREGTVHWCQTLDARVRLWCGELEICGDMWPRERFRMQRVVSFNFFLSDSFVSVLVAVALWKWHWLFVVRTNETGIICGGWQLMWIWIIRMTILMLLVGRVSLYEERWWTRVVIVIGLLLEESWKVSFWESCGEA